MKSMFAITAQAFLSTCSAACTPQQANTAVVIGVSDAEAACVAGEAAGAVAQAFDPKLASSQRTIAAGCTELQQVEQAP